MRTENDMLTDVMDDREQVDPVFAAARPKIEAVMELVKLRREIGLTQKQVADRMGQPAPRVNAIEIHPDRATWERIHAYANALGADFRLVTPGTTEELLAIRAGAPAIDVKAVGKKLQELSELLSPLTDQRNPVLR